MSKRPILFLVSYMLSMTVLANFEEETSTGSKTPAGYYSCNLIVFGVGTYPIGVGVYSSLEEAVEDTTEIAISEGYSRENILTPCVYTGPYIPPKCGPFGCFAP